MGRMAEQETRERDDATPAHGDGSDASSGQDAEQQGSGEQQQSGASQDSGEKSQDSSEKSQDSGEESQDSGEKSQDSGEKSQDSGEKSQDSGEKTQDSGAEKTQDSGAEKTQDSGAEKTQDSGEKTQDSEGQTEKGHDSEEKAEQQPAGRSADAAPADDQKERRSRIRSLDVSELIWKGANVLATVVRVVTILFAAILVVQIVLSIAAVNPANGLTRFVRGFSDTVVLGFRDLFLPSDPTVMVIVNYGVAAVFWVLVGLFVSIALRWVAARIS